MKGAKFTTIPLRCPSCGQQTHKTLKSVVHDKGFRCKCGAHHDIDVEKFATEIVKSESGIKDFGKDG